jgi:hypothetical protein
MVAKRLSPKFGMIYRMRHVRVATVLIASLVMRAALAAPFAVQVGEARIGLDAPPGFADTAFTGSPRLQELAESLTSPSNRILLFAISDGDLRKFTLGDPPELRRYMLATTPKELERSRVTREAFSEFAAAAARELGERAPAGKSFSEYFDAQPPGKPSVLGELRRDAEVVSTLVGARVQPQGRSQRPHYVLSTSTLILVRNKALSLAVYSAYDNPADLDWIRAITARWIDELQRLNSR